MTSIAGFPGENPTSRPNAWVLTLIVFAAILVRAVFLAPMAVSGNLDDPDNYLPLAHSLIQGQGFAINGRPTAYRPPLYPIVLTPVVAVSGGRVAWGVGALHLTLGVATVLMTAVAARRLGLTPNRVLFAAAAVALDPVLVSQSKSVMTETLAACQARRAEAARSRSCYPIQVSHRAQAR